ncbi:uncharacterized protein LOC119067871 isoform X2 [Bradysia coprophila]|uniref:uncharacterized protein LOC119067871 isoform X2 n=1 Tax=Bradysia coprophila TaxID=38358 RepID=UPI00187DBD28|nr:uncharacterized protein LOC119067871 isoform X2 [Bradysia coprophila]
METMNYSLLFTTIIFISKLNAIYCQEKRPIFRILAPQVICKNTKDDAADTPPQITISMQTEGGQKLTYRVRMYFEVLGGYQGQQKALSLWRAVRTMEKKINIKDKDLISDKNQINVNNTELVQGVYYVFTITGIDENGYESEPDNFTVTYSDGKIKRTNPDGSVIPDDITFLMLGSETAYANLEYKIEANVKFCTPRYNYYFEWEVSNLPERHKNIVNIPGSTLRVPVGVFEAGHTYTISAKLVQSNDSRVLLSDSINVSIKKRGFTAKLIPENVLIGISRPLELRLLYSDLDNSGLKPNISWMCKEVSDDHDCDNVEEISEYQLSVEIYEKGTYAVDANVLLDTSVTAVSNILVDPEIIVVPLFKNPPLQAIPAEDSFEMETTIDGLIPYCHAYWSVVNETGYEYFDSTLIPGGLGNISITDIEGNFLSELADFVNSTVTRDISLVVPRKGAFPDWNGLKPNSKYKFRLITTCPAPIYDSMNQTKSQTRQNATSYADITILTNQAPVGKPLEVTPQTGVGMKTVFKFSTGVALDESDDYPLKYNFLIEFDGIKISIGEFYENMVTTSPLPFSETNVTTMYETCDSREACSIVNGPTIVTTMPSDDEIDLGDIISNIKASMSRMEYDQSFFVALVAGMSLKNHNLFASFKENFTKIVRNEINRLLENPTSYIPPLEIVKFVNYSKTSHQIISEDDAINRGLLELLEMTENREYAKQIRSEPIASRKKRALKDIDSKTERMNLELQMLEKLIQSKNETESVDAMKRLTEKVKTFVTRLCNGTSFSSVILNKSIINMEIRETSVNQIIRTNLTIPYDSYQRRSYIQINGNLKVNPRNRFCVGKIMFPSDYLSGQKNANEIYDLIIVEKSTGEINVVDVSDGNRGEQSVSLSIPITKESGNFECQVWENGVWSSNVCTTSSIKNGYVYCGCKKISTFRAVEKVSEMNSTTANVAVTTLPTTIEPVPSPPGTIAPVEVSTNPATITTTTTELLTSTVNTTVNLVTTSLAETTHNEPTTTTTTVMSVTTIANNILNATASDIVEIVTLNNTSTLTTALSSTSSNLSLTTLTEPTTLLANATTILPETTNSNSETIFTTIVSTINGTVTGPHKDTLTASEKTSYSSTTGYTLAVIFIVAGIFIVAAVFIYNRRKKPNSLAQQLEIISSEIRTSNNAVKYARFHDEQTMRGDNIETIFTAQ